MAVWYLLGLFHAGKGQVKKAGLGTGSGLCAALLLLWLTGWQAVMAAGTEIVTEVRMETRDDAAEQAAMEASLIEALETLTHNEDIGKSAAARKLKKKLQDYLLEFEFTEAEDEGWLLRSRFDREALAAALQREQGAAAPLVREEVLFWLVYGYGDKPGKVLGQLGNEKLVKHVEDAAAAVGVKAILPLYDLADKQAVSVADIEMGYVEGIEKATGRYHVNQYLTGEMRYKDKIWHVRLEQYGVVSIGESPNAVRAMQLALNQLRIDTADISAPSGSDGEAVRIAVAYVKSYGDYRRLARYLEDVEGVAKVKPAGNSGDLALFDIELSTSESVWLARLRQDGVLADSPASPGEKKVDRQFYLTGNGLEQ